MTTPAYTHFHRLQAACEALEPLATAVASPNNLPAFQGALDAARAGLIKPILVGQPDRIREAAAQAGVGPDEFEIVAATDEHDAAARAVRLVHDGRARAVMKGNLHSDVLLAAVVARDTGLRGERRLSHVFSMDVPGYDRLFHITDGALNIAPDIKTRIDIIHNAGELAIACGVSRPKIAVMSAVESPTANIQSSLDAAELAAMNATEFPRFDVHGPLAMDNAMCPEAARIKKIDHPVAGHADVLVVPTIEAGNMVVKALTFVAGAETAGIVLGARVPVMLTSRADSPLARRMSCVLALLLEHWQRTGESRLP
ncbi:MAG: bifunctional enoyl-CoA hydratase/phosphate acetyltransferase [Burkholderiaceae bacterium]